VRFRVDSGVLAEVVGWTARSVPGRPSAPILAGMLLAADDRLTLSAFDEEVAARDSVPVEPREPGRALVSGRLLAEISKSLPPGPVEVRHTGSAVTLRCPGTRFTLRTLPVEDYPALPAPPPVAGAVGADDLAAAIGQVCLAAARDDALPVLSGVRVELRPETLVLACTDRYRVAVRELPWRPARPGVTGVALVPARTLAATARWLTAGAEVTLSLTTPDGPGGAGEGLIGFACDERQTTARLLDAPVVDYVARLPHAFVGRAEVDSAALLDAVRRVALVAARHTPVRLTFTAPPDGTGPPADEVPGDEVRPGRLVLEANTGDEAHAVEELPAGLVGPDVTIAFNPQFLLDGLAAVESDTTLLQFTGKDRPAMVTGKPAGPSADPGYRYLLMPVRGVF
jgi:DNA polymerase-3 subunit beta